MTSLIQFSADVDNRNPAFQQGVNGVPVHFNGIPQQQLPQTLAGNFEQLLNQPVASPNREHLQHQSQTVQALPLSPWGVPQAREP